MEGRCSWPRPMQTRPQTGHTTVAGSSPSSLSLSLFCFVLFCFDLGKAERKGDFVCVVVCCLLDWRD